MGHTSSLIHYFKGKHQPILALKKKHQPIYVRIRTLATAAASNKMLKIAAGT